MNFDYCSNDTTAILLDEKVELRMKKWWLPVTIGIICFFMLFACSDEARTDEKIMQEVQKLIKKEERFETVQVNVRNNIVILTGQCEGEGCSKDLVKKVKTSDGVNGVENDITEGALLPNY